MLYEESIWLGEQLRKLPGKEVSPMLNVGSSTLHFRTVVQPHIQKNVIDVLEASGISIIHSDIDAGDGVDIVGDLTDQKFLKELQSRNYNSVLCCNLLEHVPNRQEIATALLNVVKPGGFLIITVPNRFPYHGHPIDTMFRPGIAGLQKLFPGTELVVGSLVKSSRTQFNDFPKTPRYFLGMAKKLLMPFREFFQWRHFIGYMPFWFSRYRVTCIVLKKVS